MLFDISELGPSGASIDRTVQLAPLEGLVGEAVPLGDVLVNGWLRPTSRGVEFQGRFSTVARLQCHRCLGPLQELLEGEFRLFLVNEEREEVVEGSEIELEEDSDAIDLFPAQGGKVDLAALLREQITLALPARVLCVTDCKGLCPGCGADLNHEACRCQRADQSGEHSLERLGQIWAQRKGDGPSGRK